MAQRTVATPIRVGDTFDRWEVKEAKHARNREGKIVQKWLCKCICGTEKVVFAANLRRGFSRSCGCLSAELAAERNTTHGCSWMPEHGVWYEMIKRCHDPDSDGFAKYGQRGIAVCDRWRESFQAFLEDMGPRPSPRHSVERIYNSRGYELGNCRWATAREQANNRRSNPALGSKHTKHRRLSRRWPAG